MRNPYEIIERPLVTEKSINGASQGKYTFRVRKDANKLEIASAIAEIFQVKVADVNTMIVKGKKRRLGRHPEGKTADWKKAVVTLQPGFTIDVFEGM